MGRYFTDGARTHSSVFRGRSSSPKTSNDIGAAQCVTRLIGTRDRPINNVYQTPSGPGGENERTRGFAEIVKQETSTRKIGRRRVTAVSVGGWNDRDFD